MTVPGRKIARQNFITAAPHGPHARTVLKKFYYVVQNHRPPRLRGDPVPNHLNDVERGIVEVTLQAAVVKLGEAHGKLQAVDENTVFPISSECLPRRRYVRYQMSEDRSAW